MKKAWSYAKVKSVFMRNDFNEQIVTVSLNVLIPGNGIKKVVFNKPATIVLWNDGTKTVVKCQEEDEFSEETWLALAIAKRAFGNTGAYNEVFKQWCGKETKNGD